MKPTLYAGVCLLVTVLASYGNMPKDDAADQQIDSVRVDTSKIEAVNLMMIYISQFIFLN